MTSATVIVPTVKGGERLRRALSSLAGAEEIIVVDNACCDPAMAELPGRFSGVRVLKMGHNAGFGAAINAAARVADGDVLVLVNDDCVCGPGFVEALAGRIDAAAGLTMAAGVLREAADPEVIDSAGIEIDRTLLGFDYLNGTAVADLDDGVPDPLGPTGGAAAYDRRAFLEQGGFDEALFAYWEDVDLALRMRLAGMRCALAIDAQAIHEHSGTAGSGSPAKNRMMGFGRGYVLRKYGGLSAGRLPGILARDGVVLAGQLVADRNLAGLRGRVAGWRAGRPEFEYPGALVESFGPPSLRETLRWRAARRARLRGAGGGALVATRRKPPSLPGQGSGKLRPDTGRKVTDLPDLAVNDPRPARAVAILHVAELSGPALSLESRLRWLAETAHLDVIVPGEGATADLYRQFATVHTVPFEPLMLPRSPGSVLSLARRTKQDATNFQHKLRELQPNLLLTSTATLPAAQIAARREGVPVAIEASELLTSGRAAPRRAIGRALVRAAAKRADIVFACSHAVAAEYAGGDAPVFVSYPPIEDRYGGGDAAGFRGRHEIPEGAPVVLAAGSITERRGQDVLIEAVEIVNHGREPAAVCVIAGEPFPRGRDLDYQQRLEMLAGEAGGTVRLIGFQSDLSDAFAAAAVVVNPRRDAEAFGRVPCEALLAGCPVVAARTGGVAEVLGDGETALLVAPGDAASTAVAIQTLLDVPELATALVARGRADVLRRFTDEAAIAVFASGLRLLAVA